MSDVGHGSTRTPTLFPLPPAEGGLTDRQQAVLETIGRDGITTYQAGIAAGAQPAWARTNGLQILRALKARGLVVERRNPMRFELAHKPKVPSGDIPF